jgi:hypothetical protein
MRKVAAMVRPSCAGAGHEILFVESAGRCAHRRSIYIAIADAAQSRNWAQYSRRQLLAFNDALCMLLLQFRVLRLGLIEDGDVGVGVFPEGEEVLILIATLGRVSRNCVCASKAQMRE